MKRITILIASILSLACSTSWAQIFLRADDQQITSDPSAITHGEIDLYFHVVNTTESLAGYQVQLSVTPASSGLQFAGAVNTSGATHPPIFPSDAPVVIPPTGNLLQATAFLSVGSVSITDGLGLLRARYDVNPGVVGVFQITFDPIMTQLSDADINPIPVVLEDFQIAVVPEPAAGVATGCALLALAGWARFRFGAKPQQSL